MSKKKELFVLELTAEQIAHMHAYGNIPEEVMEKIKEHRTNFLNNGRPSHKKLKKLLLNFLDDDDGVLTNYQTPNDFLYTVKKRIDDYLEKA